MKIQIEGIEKIYVLRDNKDYIDVNYMVLNDDNSFCSKNRIMLPMGTAEAEIKEELQKILVEEIRHQSSIVSSAEQIKNEEGFRDLSKNLEGITITEK